MEVSSDVIVAVVGSVGVCGAAAIGVFGEAIRRQARATREAVGTPNGHGNVVEMLERILASQAGQDRRLARLEERQLELTRTAAEHASRIAELEHR